MITGETARSTSELRGLFIVPTDYAALKDKGVLHMLDARDEGGGLNRVITVHPFTSHEQTLNLHPHHFLYEFKQPVGSSFRSFAWFRFAQFIFGSARRIRYLAKHHACNFVRAQDPYFSGLLGWLATRFLPRIPFCISLHADYDKRYALDGARGAPEVLGSRKLAKCMENFLLRQADMVLPIRESIAAKVESIGVPRERIAVIPHGIDMSRYRNACQRGDLPSHIAAYQNQNLLVFAGRLSRENYVFDLLTCAEALAQRRQDFLLTIAGDGPERNALQGILDRNPSLTERVRLLGFLSNEIVATLRLRSMIGIVPMGGFSLIEACAAGHPVLAYDVEWHSELVRDGETGFLVPEGDVEKLVECADYLLANPDIAKAMGKQAQTLAFSRHDIPETRRCRLEIYRNLSGKVS